MLEEPDLIRDLDLFIIGSFYCSLFYLMLRVSGMYLDLNLWKESEDDIPLDIELLFSMAVEGFGKLDWYQLVADKKFLSLDLQLVFVLSRDLFFIIFYFYNYECKHPYVLNNQ